ncbi:MAG: hypothetical protein H8E48_04110 [Chloroflexi bacterium]|nr:hypothetical protein [Chloroflexota bacterium]
MTTGKQPFSQRYGMGAEKKPLQTDDLPKWIRAEFIHVLKQNTGQNFCQSFYESLRPLIWEVTNEKPADFSPWDDFSWNVIEDVLSECQWAAFFEACEVAVELTTYSDGLKIQSDMNKLFARDLLAWRFEGGEVVLAQPAAITAIIEEVKGILAEPRFAVPNDQFRKANGHLNSKPTPDTENCIKDAIGALEGVAQIVMGQVDGTLGDLLKKGVLKSDIPLHLNKIIDRIYVYRGNQDGVAHAKTSHANIPIQDANYVLSLCAASIVYLGQKIQNNNS